MRQMAEHLSIDLERIAAWAVAQAVLSACWSFEDGDPDIQQSVGMAQWISEAAELPPTWQRAGAVTMPRARLRFDFAATGWPEGPLCFESPIEIVEAWSLDEVGPAIAKVAAAARGGAWCAGFVAYEAAPAFDTAMRVHTPADGPLVWFGLFDGPHSCDAEALAECESVPLHASISKERYLTCVEAIRGKAAAGDLYQANFTFQMSGCAPGDPVALYHAARDGAGYAACLDLEEQVIVSLSPELFFQYDAAAGKIVTRPMKGTRRRGRWAQEDEAACSGLERSAKDRAENLMIVDLLRNDLGRIARPGEVRANPLFSVERYPTVWQMTSTISAATLPGTSLAQIFGALFPCGSVTGAPKIAAMGAIADLEESARGVYCGAIGMVMPGGSAVFNVAIRTLTINTRAGVAAYGVGGGITWDSRPEDEYDEALSKAVALNRRRRRFQLLETLRLESGRFHLPDRHVVRMLASARYFDWPLTRAAVCRALSGAAEAHPLGAWRVRLRANSRGEVVLGEYAACRDAWSAQVPDREAARRFVGCVSLS